MTTSPSLAGRFIGPIGAVAVLAYAVFAAVQIQVLNPLATMPGYTLQEIHAAVAQRDSADTMGWGLMSVTLAIGPLIALIVARLGVLGVAGKDVVDVGAAVAVMGDSSAAQTALEVGGPQARPLISC